METPREAEQVEVEDSSGTLQVYCPKGFQQIGVNHVFVYLNGINVSEPLGRLVNAYFLDDDLGIPSWENGYDIRQGRHLRLASANSFTLEDLEDVLQDIFMLPIIIHDGVQLPHDCQ